MTLLPLIRSLLSLNQESYIFYGGFVALLSELTAVYFDSRRISSIIGLLYTSVGIGTLVGPGLAGPVYGLSHSYTLPILVSAAANLIAVLCMLLLKGSTRQQEHT